MKLLAGWVVSAGLVFTAAAAQAQGLAPYELGGPRYQVVSDVGGPYAAMPTEVAPPRYRGYGPSLLPPTEVYTVVRESGFSPLGIPRQRGFIYTISVIDRGGDDGRLVIDARTGRIIRFVPAARIGETFDDDLTASYGPVGPMPPVVRGSPRPPAAVPRVASRTPSVPMPKASPHAVAPKPLAAKPVPAPAQQSGQQQSAIVQAKPAEATATPPAIAPPAAAAIQPTQEMPKVQGLE